MFSSLNNDNRRFALQEFVDDRVKLLRARRSVAAKKRYAKNPVKYRKK